MGRTWDSMSDIEISAAKRTLVAARKLFTDEGSWCRYAMARDRAGNACFVHDPSAIQYC
jgi:hypothetical protein